MFEWLREELASIRTPKFHVTDGPADQRLVEAVVNSQLSLPVQYREFVLAFGSAKLYRQSRCGYLIGVFAGPRAVELGKPFPMYQIGFEDSEAVYLRRIGGEWFLYRGGRKPAREVARDFDVWLESACRAARCRYSDREWRHILRGPLPFSEHEESIIVTRRRFEWQVLELDESGDRIIKVRNGGNRTIPFLTVGVRSKDGRLNGAVRLKVDHVQPGESELLRAPCYKELFPAEQIELFPLPDPKPEDRDYYAEFMDV